MIAERVESYNKVFDCADEMPQLPEVPEDGTQETNRKRVTRPRRVNHIVGRHLWRKKRTTIADQTAPPAPDPVMRRFTADTLNTRRCGNIAWSVRR
ncbi:MULTISPECIES: hypothetical protein [unclassified Streptomyces]|uniref:hypothetical protein n=1 Tax=unclassified Streptomyces TaxID=2593676 RepID=UPI0035D552C9